MPALLALLGGVGAIIALGIPNSTNTTTPSDTVVTSQGLPSWALPATLLLVGAVLFYKEGAKLLEL